MTTAQVAPRVLVIDDHPATRSALVELARGEGFEVFEAESVEGGRAALAERPDLILVDLKLPDGSGLSVLDRLDFDAAPAVVLITGHGSLDSAVEALRRGVTDYLTKPVDIERLRSILGDVSRTTTLPDEINALRVAQRSEKRFHHLIGVSAPMLAVYDLISRVAPTSATVMISGDSGTGKELVAQTIHDLSRRRHGPFVPVNCGAISPTLMESLLFGHERGAFTGAERRHRGFFEQSHRGTLFLDEITEMPVELQVKLLRLLETDTFSRVGGESGVRVDCRIVTATNRRLDDALAAGRLREDLYYRLKVVQVHLPPLRERAGDVEVLASHFLDETSKREGATKRLHPSALRILEDYQWPGNVRELKNVVHSAFILAQDTIQPDCLPAELTRPRVAAGADASSVNVPIGTPIEEAERRLILATLEHYAGNKTRTAEVLGISLKTLYTRLHSYKGSVAGA